MADAPEKADRSSSDQKPASETPPPDQKENQPQSQPPPPQQPQSQQQPPQPPPPKRKNKGRIIMGIVIALIVIIGVVVYYEIFQAPYEDTDDAFIEGHVTMVSPRVSGPVVHLLIDDNQKVKAGDLLLEIDPADYQVQLAQAQAALAVAQSQVVEAQAQIVVADARVTQAEASVTSAEANAKRANDDLARYLAVESRTVSRTQVDQIQTQAKSNNADLEVARSGLKAAQAQAVFSKTQVDTAMAEVKRAQAQVHQAELQLSYTRITASVDGQITRRTVEQGDFVQTGQALLTLVPKNVWVVANFKETQLNEMRTGQPVTVTLDAYPGHKFKAKVDSFQSGTGSRFSLLPPENAVGNYVKVVQRIPVKIVFDEALPAELDIAPGLSAVPKVKVK